jgi:hypothetical protein
LASPGHAPVALAAFVNLAETSAVLQSDCYPITKRIQKDRLLVCCPSPIRKPSICNGAHPVTLAKYWWGTFWIGFVFVSAGLAIGDRRQGG